CRKELAAELGWPLGFLDEEYKERRKPGKATASQECFTPIEPWPEPVAGDALLRDIMRRLKRHIVFSNDEAVAVALWIAFAWTHDAVTHSPMLLVTSAEKNSGKTTLLGLIRFLV